MQNIIFVAGHNGMVGADILKQLSKINNTTVITKSRKELDLTNQEAVKHFFQPYILTNVYLCTTKVGGIYAKNQYPVEFIYQNLCIQNNAIHQAYLAGVKKLLFQGSSCVYPELAEQPITEATLLSGPLEPPNEPDTLAKIVRIKPCKSYNRQYKVDYRNVMPTNPHDENDNFRAGTLPCDARRFTVIPCEAKVANLPSGT